MLWVWVWLLRCQYTTWRYNNKNMTPCICTALLVLMQLPRSQAFAQPITCSIGSWMNEAKYSVPRCQPLSTMCHHNFIRAQPENSIRQENTLGTQLKVLRNEKHSVTMGSLQQKSTWYTLFAHALSLPQDVRTPGYFLILLCYVISDFGLNYIATCQNTNKVKKIDTNILDQFINS